MEPTDKKPTGPLAALLTGVSLLILVGLLWPESMGRVAPALLVSSVPVLLILLSCSAALSRPLLAAMAALWLLLGGSWVALIWVAEAEVPAVGGVPAVLWILIVGLGLLPLGLVAWAYAATFKADEPTRENSRRVEETGLGPGGS